MGATNIKNTTGTPVTRENFFGRVNEVRDGWTLIEEGKSLKLDAPRRVGKSSFAYKMIEIAEAQGWKCAFWNVEGCQNEQSLYHRFISVLEKNNQKSATKNKWDLKKIEVSIQAIAKLGVTVENENNTDASQGNNIFSNLERIIDHAKDTLIVIDEIAVYLNHLEVKGQLSDARQFLHWLSSQRQVPNSRVRWILCSSISIDTFIDRHEINKTMKGIENFPIDELKGNEPVLLIEALATSAKLYFSDEAKKCMLDKLGWHLPYYIQRLFQAVRRLEETDVSVNTVEKAYRNILDAAGKDDYFKTIYQDLNNNYKDNKEYARLLLDTISKSLKGSSVNVLKSLIFDKVDNAEKAETIFKELLEKLKNDGYIMSDEKGKKYVFRSPLIRDFWYNRFMRK
ncbi:MAG: hypothetical protein LBK45_01115 [Tannerellaceae bacterium]|nr:hypothetical protein [Tannerellaceae bacterium]